MKISVGAQSFLFNSCPLRQKANAMLFIQSKINITAHKRFYYGAKRAYIGSERIARSYRPVIAIVSKFPAPCYPCALDYWHAKNPIFGD